MIESFVNKETEKIFKGIVSKKLPIKIQKTARRKLLYLDGADSLGDLAVPPGNRLEALHGDREGQHSIRINDQWQICFTWANSKAKDVEIIDCHT